MSGLDQDIAGAVELFGGLGALTHRKMFGGAALYCDGQIFALIVDGRLMIKVDSARAPELARDLEAEGAERWTYEGKKKAGPVAMPYWSLPDSAIDDPDAALEWARWSLASTS